MFEHSGIDYDGTKPGSTMETASPDKPAMIAAALHRLSVRWDTAIGRARTGVPRVISRIHDEVEVDFAAMPADDRRKLGEWFTARYQYLQEEYRIAINESDNIIGKQWLYDNRPKLVD